ncbi:MAG: 16S rRNA (guanine(527)-N(7))-methyltransferase RsmG [Actinomycetota bacterium]|nr:16S rRNA (guanine(527)-N(7))-methyltransferase RsmG [Actinomycetota bacterium]
MAETFLERWLEGVLATPGLTGLGELGEARRVLLEDALRAVSLIEDLAGPVVDVGSGGGSPGIPLAVALPHREFTLLEAERRKCDFLRGVAAELPNVEVIWGRAEEQPTDGFAVALAKALAKPPVAAELCLPLVRPGGIAILWTGETASPEQVAVVASHLFAGVESDENGLLVLRKLGPTPTGFPRRAGMAKKRPLA